MEISIQDIVQHAGKQTRAVQASDIRAKHGTNTIVLFAVGNYYEAYNESAVEVHKHCKFTLGHTPSFSHVTFKKSCDYWVLPKLVRAGFKICIIE